MSGACDFYVYLLFRADRTTPFYVGKGRGDRVNAHSRTCELSRGKGRIKEAIARKVVAAIGYVPHRIIYDALSEHEALSVEAGVIASLGRIDIKTGILANMTNGGEGASGNVQSAADRAKKSAANLRPETRARKSNALRETFSRPEIRAKLSAGQRRARANPEIALRLETIRAASFAKPGVQERRKAAVADALKRPETRARLSAAQKEIGARPEVIEKRRAGANKRWADPAQREAHSRRMRERHAARKLAAHPCA